MVGGAVECRVDLDDTIGGVVLVATAGVRHRVPVRDSVAGPQDGSGGSRRGGGRGRGHGRGRGRGHCRGRRRGHGGCRRWGHGGGCRRRGSCRGRGRLSGGGRGDRRGRGRGFGWGAVWMGRVVRAHLVQHMLRWGGRGGGPPDQKQNSQERQKAAGRVHDPSISLGSGSWGLSAGAAARWLRRFCVFCSASSPRSISQERRRRSMGERPYRTSF